MKPSADRRSVRHGVTITAAAALGVVLAAGPVAIAQGQDVITVTAPRTVRHTTVEHNRAGAEIEEISLTRSVSYAGLDLGNPANVAELEKRIDATAAEACEQLDKLYTRTSADKDCASRAAGPARESLRAIIAGRPK